MGSSGHLPISLLDAPVPSPTCSSFLDPRLEIGAFEIFPLGWALTYPIHTPPPLPLFQRGVTSLHADGLRRHRSSNVCASGQRTRRAALRTARSTLVEYALLWTYRAERAHLKGGFLIFFALSMCKKLQRHVLLAIFKNRVFDQYFSLKLATISC